MLKQKMAAYDLPQRVTEMGIYPFFRTIESEQDTEVIISGKKVLMFGSNSYLGLTSHPKLKEASKAAIDKYGSGCAGSRFLNGTLDLHLELEEKLAKFVGKEGTLVFSTGFQVNLGVLSSIPSRHDYIIIDDLDHACIIDGARLSFGKTLKYRHNDMASLEKILQKTEMDKVKIIAVDGVFSMEGAADNDTINFLKHNARSLIFSASIAPANAASVIAAIDLIYQEPERIDKLWSNTRHAMERLRAEGFDIGHTETPIIPIYIRDDFKTFKLTKLLLEDGIFVNPVVSPAVPSSSSLLRYSIMATHTIDQIDESIDKITKISKELGILEDAKVKA